MPQRAFERKKKVGNFFREEKSAASLRRSAIQIAPGPA
jgi:hypothetical protein